MDAIDRLIGQLLGREVSEGPTPGCPDDEALVALGAGFTAKGRRGPLWKHIGECPECRARLGVVLAAQDEVLPVDERVLERARSIVSQGGPSLSSDRPVSRTSASHSHNLFYSNMLRHIWLGVSLICFGLSLFFPRYFIQFTALTVVFGLKWVFDTATTRQLIMIYDAWKERWQRQKHS